MKIRNLSLCGLALSALLPLQAFSQDQYHKEFGDYTVHYNLINTTELTDEIAERYEVEQDPDVALLTISVRQEAPGRGTEDKPSDLSGTVRDLVRIYDLEFEEFRDPHAVYYLAEVPAGGRTNLQFDISVQPQGTGKTFNLEFSELVPARPLN